jgi:hypothetical protein
MSRKLCTGCLAGMVLIDQAVAHVRDAYPHWRRSGGADHVIPAFYDYSICMVGS